MRASTLLCLWLLASGSPSLVGQALPRAHSHNDYQHPRPLLDALDRGFCSVEADIHLVGQSLLVAHDLEDVAPDRTLEALYLDPLRERFAGGPNRILDGCPAFTLLIDVKSHAETTYGVLRAVLTGYEGLFTRFGPDSVVTGPVTVVLAGNRPLELLQGEEIRLVGYDGRLPDLRAAEPLPASFMPLVSASWNQVSDWRGWGHFAETDRATLEEWVVLAHRQGKRLRFWGTADNPNLWRELYTAGVDLINTDNLDALRIFLEAQESSTP